MDLGDIVLSWSIQDIINDDLYQGQVEPIPCSFTSLDHYLKSYHAPLIEETRSHLCSCLELIMEGPSSKILSLDGTEKPEVYYMDVDFWDYGAAYSTEAHTIRNGDVFILSSMKPEAVEDFNRYGVTYYLAMVTDVCTDDDDECQKHFKIKVAQDIGLEEDLQKLRYAFFLGNIITNMWIWKALSFDKHMNNNFTVIEPLLAPTNSVGDVRGICAKHDGEHLACVPEQLLKGTWRGSDQGLSIGVVSPYSCQVNAIKDRLGNKYDTCDGFHVTVKSIDGFQGEEDDIIILSTVRSNERGGLGFLADNRRTNVALTRARHCLWIVGNATTLYGSGTVWKNLVDDARSRKCIINASNDATMCKLILHVKQELDDLLNADSAIFSNTRWKVVLSDGFRKSFIALKSPQLKREVLQKLVKLGAGWRPTVKNIDICDTFQLAKVFKVRDFYLIWNIDMEKKEIRIFQIIRIWDLLSRKHVARIGQRLENMFSMYTDDYLDHCRRVQTDGKLEVPAIWDVEHDIIRYKDCTIDAQEDHDLMDTSCVMENLKVSESFLLMKFYSLSSGVAKHLLTATDGYEIDIPFELTDEEDVIIRFPQTSFILGRSGTGKTTVLTMKLLQVEQKSLTASRGLNLDEVGLLGACEENTITNDTKEESFVKQVFITVSPKLCSAIKNQICRLKRFVAGDAPDQPSTDMHDIIDDMEQSTEIPDNFCDLPCEHYPLAITYRKFLMMLDGTFQTSFFDIFYGELSSSTERGYSKSRALQTLIELKEVTYEKFAASYWPHFNADLTKKFDASTVFTEIISHIKGGYQASRPSTGKLERPDYVMLSDKRFSSLNSEKRDRIYDIFLDYESMKCSAREFDLSDFVNSLHKCLVSEGYNGDMLDIVYVDEVQDLTMTQIVLLKYVCRNFKEGFHFAGDTAQTIARGVDFRFEDIRSLFYTTFLSETKACNQGNKPGKQCHLSDMFQLTQNFRTHSGILRMAQSIIDLLYFFFPSSVDKLNPETGLVYGEPPVLLETGNDKNAIVNIFGEKKSKHGNLHGFGAEQVILVRDDDTKKQIVDLVGKQALVLTIVECKGLEFQDVLLYNIFSSSPLKNKWRVVYGYMKNKSILSSPEEMSHPDFDRNKHCLLCSELKQLYVAITRTRQRLWICETGDDYCRPMFDFWNKLCLVEVRLLDSSFIEAMKTGSSADDWRRRGTKLFNEGQFEMATMCFEKANDAYREKWARAAGLVATADGVMPKNLELCQASLQKAAEIYESIGMHEKAATCYIKLKDYKRAGMIYTQNCSTSRLEDAGDCFAMTECWSEAAEAYFKAKCYTQCFSMCSKGKLFSLGLQFLQQLWEEAAIDESNIGVLYSPAAYGLIVDSLDAHLRPSNKKLTHGHLGRMAILLLNVVPWGAMLTSRLMQYLDNESEWAIFFQSLDIFVHHSHFDFVEHIQSQHPSGLDGRYSLLLNLKLALESIIKFTLNANWRAEPDYISPMCCVDLIECLGYFASSCFALHGCMFSTESIFVKMIKRRSCSLYFQNCLMSTADRKLEKLSISAGRLIYESARSLLTKRHMIQEWAQKTTSASHILVLMRLVVTLYLVPLNLNVGDCYEATRFLQMHRVFEDLPLEFSQKILGALQIRSPKLGKFRRLFADALEVIGERMLVAGSPRVQAKYRGLNAIIFSSWDCTLNQIVHTAKSFFHDDSIESSFLGNVERKSLLPCEMKRVGKKIGDVEFWEKFEAFHINKQGQKDARAIVVFLRSVLSWLTERGPPTKIDVDLLLEVRQVCNNFDKQSDDSAEKRACVTAKELFSTWKDGGNKLKKIISFLRSEKASMEEGEKGGSCCRGCPTAD
ncbi:putative ATP-dependent helicase [Hordeum vulgare]|nr:putative ATP-dependent helicase [Hordeum vulgare]